MIGWDEHGAVRGIRRCRGHRRMPSDLIAHPHKRLHLRIIKGNIERDTLRNGAYLSLQCRILGAQAVDELPYRIENLLVILANDRPRVNGDATGIRHDIGLHPTRDGGHIHGETAQQRVLLVGDVCCRQGLQQLVHVHDGIHTRWGIEPWAVFPLVFSSSQSTPFSAVKTRFAVGSPMTMNPTSGNFCCSTRRRAPMESTSSPAVPANSRSPFRDTPVRCIASMAMSIAATPDFISAAPRPQILPSLTSAARISCCQLSPAGTVS